MELNTMSMIITVSKLPHFILKACQKTPIVLLLILAIVTLATGLVEEGIQTGWLIGSLILVFRVLRIASASVSSFYRARKMEMRLIHENNSGVTVIRHGQRQVVRLCDIKEGDLVCLTAGDRIPAEGVLISHSETGSYRYLYSGTTCVLDGVGLMLVTSAGRNTESSKMMMRSVLTNFKDDDKLLVEARLKKPNPFPGICDLKKEKLVCNWIDEPFAQLGNFALVTLIISVLVKFILFSFDDQNKKNNLVQELKGAAGVEGLIKIFKQLLNNGGKVSLLAGCIPALVFGLQHGIKIVISFCLKKWNGKRGSGQNSSASTTLGVASVVCIDISGRLMFQKRSVCRFQIGQENMISVSNTSASKMSQTVLDPLIQGIGASVLLVPAGIIGSPSRTDDLLISWVKQKWNIDIKSGLKERFEIVSHRKLSSNKEGRGVQIRRRKSGGNGKNIWASHWKGDAHTILDMCSCYYDWKGQIHEMKNQKSRFEQVIKEMEGNGMRAIAFAYKQTEVLQELNVDDDGLCLLAIVGVKYQCDEEMKSSVRALINTGRSIILVSKHKFSTLIAMAWGLGKSCPVSTEEALEREHHVSIGEKIDQITIMRSSNPMEKLLMIKSLKQKDDIVAFIGGRTTRDAPLLQEADVGITIETWSTEITREISDIVLPSVSSFSPLITILESGRQEYLKIQKFILMEIISNISVLLITSVETVCLEESSITIWNALYLNLVLAFLGGLGLMLVMKPQNKEVRSNIRIGKRKESIVTKLMMINIVVQVSYQVIIFLVFRFKGEALNIPGVNPMNQQVIKAMIFNGFLLCQVFNHLHPLFDSGEIFIWLFVLVPFTGMHVLGFTELLKLTRIQWASCFLVAVLSWGINSATISISILVKEKKKSLD